MNKDLIEFLNNFPASNEAEIISWTALYKQYVMSDVKVRSDVLRRFLPYENIMALDSFSHHTIPYIDFLVKMGIFSFPVAPLSEEISQVKDILIKTTKEITINR